MSHIHRQVLGQEIGPFDVPRRTSMHRAPSPGLIRLSLTFDRIRNNAYSHEWDITLKRSVTLPHRYGPGSAARGRYAGRMRNTSCYADGMANTRFTISTDPEVHSAIKAHADAAGLDVSAYMIAAAVAQMAADDAAAAVFAPLDAEHAAALEQATALPAPELLAFEDLSAAEQALVRRVVSAALASDHSEVA